MATRPTVSNRMRVYHRYLGFFLAGIMAVYSISGIVMIFRDTDFLKTSSATTQKKVAPGLGAAELAKALNLKEVDVEGNKGDIIEFNEGGTYNKVTGEASYKVKALPTILSKLTKLHKAKSKEPLFFLNIFFGVSLLFFVISSFWMFMPKTTIFKKGMLFTLAGLVLTLILLFI